MSLCLCLQPPCPLNGLCHEDLPPVLLALLTDALPSQCCCRCRLRLEALCLHLCPMFPMSGLCSGQSTHQCVDDLNDVNLITHAVLCLAGRRVIKASRNPKKCRCQSSFAPSIDTQSQSSSLSDNVFKFFSGCFHFCTD